MDVLELSFLQQLGLSIIIGTTILYMLVDYSDHRRKDREVAARITRYSRERDALQARLNSPEAVRDRTRQFDRVIDWTK